MSTGGQRTRQTDAGDPDLCPVGDLHKVFSTPEVIAETQNGCRAASMRCEQCKMEAARSVCAITAPIHNKRIELESRIDETWEMLRAQSAKAAVRAEQTMLAVRDVLDLSHDLGSTRRFFGATEADLHSAHDITLLPDLLGLEQDEETEMLRDHWRDHIVPRDIPLRQESNRVFTSLDRELEEPFLSAKKKRVFVTTSRDVASPDEWRFNIPARSYEVWALLCWRQKDNWLEDFVIPQKYYSQAFAKAKKSLKKDEKIPVSIHSDGDRFLLSIHGSAPVDIVELRSNYEPLR
jgi:tryptophanyl-tRNA synthetase